MKRIIKKISEKSRLVNFLSTHSFNRSKNLSQKDIATIKDSYDNTSILFVAFVSMIMICAMIFYFIYGFATNFFFNGTNYGIVKFASVAFLFVVPTVFLIIHLCVKDKVVSRRLKEFIVFSFLFLVLIGVFLFFVSDCMDPLTESSFSAGYLWMVILSIIPCLSIGYWSILSVVALGGTITVMLIFGQKQPYQFQYYLISVLVILGNAVVRSVLYRTAYYRFAEKKSGDENLLISKTDALTGIENRRGLESFVANKTPGWKMRGNYITLIMFDLDFFKEYNDTYGHVAGDKCLQDVVSSIISAFPNNSLDFFRFGGDEFIIILDEPNLSLVDTFCKKILKAVTGQKIKASDEVGKQYLSVSLGAKTLKIDDGYTIFKHVDYADKMMYQVKKNGKGYAIVNDNRLSIN